MAAYAADTPASSTTQLHFAGFGVRAVVATSVSQKGVPVIANGKAVNVHEALTVNGCTRGKR